MGSGHGPQIWVTQGPTPVEPSAPSPVLTVPAPEVPGVEPAPPAEPASTPASCSVRLALRVEPVATGYRLIASARNLTAAPLELTIQDRCPGGNAVFDGLGGTYDYYGTCNMGACIPGRPPPRVSLPPGEDVVVASAVLSKGGGTCNGPLPAGQHMLTFGLPIVSPANITTCGPEPAPLRIDAAPAPAQPSPKPTPSPQTKAPCKPGPPCGIWCQYGQAHDENGCTLCACKPSPFEEIKNRKTP